MSVRFPNPAIAQNGGPDCYRTEALGDISRGRPITGRGFTLNRTEKAGCVSVTASDVIMLLIIVHLFPFRGEQEKMF